MATTQTLRARDVRVGQKLQLDTGELARVTRSERAPWVRVSWQGNVSTGWSLEWRGPNGPGWSILHPDEMVEVQ